jgi:hypothetical protein
VDGLEETLYMQTLQEVFDPGLEVVVVPREGRETKKAGCGNWKVDLGRNREDCLTLSLFEPAGFLARTFDCIVEPYHLFHTNFTASERNLMMCMMLARRVQKVMRGDIKQSGS